MSELKADNTFVFGEECLAYKKEDADKVIAELKDKIELLENLAKSSSSDFASEYNELKIEIFKLQDRAKELENELAELREATRWRKYPEEKPCSDWYYIICGSSGFRNADRFMECKDGRGMDFSFYSYGVEYWMPMPKTPEVK